MKNNETKTKTMHKIFIGFSCFITLFRAIEYQSMSMYSVPLIQAVILLIVHYLSLHQDTNFNLVLCCLVLFLSTFDTLRFISLTLLLLYSIYNFYKPLFRENTNSNTWLRKNKTTHPDESSNNEDYKLSGNTIK